MISALHFTAFFLPVFFRARCCRIRFGNGTERKAMDGILHGRFLHGNLGAWIARYECNGPVEMAIEDIEKGRKTESGLH